MKIKGAYLSLLIVAMLAFLAVPASAQDAENPVQAAALPVSEQVGQTMATEELSIYGEVQSVDTTGTGSLTVQYYDYDADDEKMINIALDTKTKLENANSIADIKKGDWADVVYSTAAGKNSAISIIVEKEEEATVAAAPAAPEQAVSQGQAVAKEEAASSGDLPY